VRACPNDVIEVEGEGKGKDRKVSAYHYNLARCLFCRLCVEACTFSAIEMSHEYELASCSPDLVWDLQKLLAIGDKHGVHESGKDWG
jgi:NADH-quinone oxidoreductase subunit I